MRSSSDEQKEKRGHFTDPVIKQMIQLCRNKKMKVSFRQSLLGGFIAGSIAMLGGLLGGPLWIAIGALIGGIFVVLKIDNRVENAEDMVNALDDEKKTELVAELFRTVGPSLTDVDALADLIGSSILAQEAAEKTLRQILFENGMRLNLGGRNVTY